MSKLPPVKPDDAHNICYDPCPWCRRKLTQSTDDLPAKSKWRDELRRCSDPTVLAEKYKKLRAETCRVHGMCKSQVYEVALLSDMIPVEVLQMACGKTRPIDSKLNKLRTLKLARRMVDKRKFYMLSCLLVDGHPWDNYTARLLRSYIDSCMLGETDKFSAHKAIDSAEGLLRSVDAPIFIRRT